MNKQIIHNNGNFTVTVCALTTNQRKATMPGNIILDTGEGNLNKKSIVEVYKIYEINKSMLNMYIGSLSSKRNMEILKGIKFIKDSFLQPNNRVII